MHTPNLDLSKDAVLKVLSKFKILKFPRPDNMQWRILYELRDVLRTQLLKIVNTSMQTKSLPNDWLCTNITAKCKKGSKGVSDNCRPVKLTSVMCKILETIVRKE